MAFLTRPLATRHTALPKCGGASVLTANCEVADPDGAGSEGTRKRRADCKMPSAVTFNGDHNVLHNDNSTHNTTHNTHINTLIVLMGNKAGDVVPAGSAVEAELIRKTILENPDLRRMLRTVENAPVAIFKLTKGVEGPQRMRNVRKSRGTVAELCTHGVVTSAQIEYCKKTALRLVEELQAAIDAVGTGSPKAVREWAQDVRATMASACGSLDYVTALRLYCRASSQFYKLPRECRDAVAGGVRNIADFICADTSF